MSEETTKSQNNNNGFRMTKLLIEQRMQEVEQKIFYGEQGAPAHGCSCNNSKKRTREFQRPSSVRIKQRPKPASDYTALTKLAVSNSNLAKSVSGLYNQKREFRSILDITRAMFQRKKTKEQDPNSKGKGPVRLRDVMLRKAI